MKIYHQTLAVKLNHQLCKIEISICSGEIAWENEIKLFRDTIPSTEWKKFERIVEKDFKWCFNAIQVLILWAFDYTIYREAHFREFLKNSYQVLLVLFSWKIINKFPFFCIKQDKRQLQLKSFCLFKAFWWKQRARW